MKYILPFIVAAFISGCAEKQQEPLIITKYEYIKQDIQVPNNLFIVNKVNTPTLTKDLNDKDLELLHAFILDLYTQNKSYISNLNTIKSILEAYKNGKVSN